MVDVIARISFGGDCISIDEQDVEPEIIKPEVIKFQKHSTAHAVEVAKKANELTFFQKLQIKFFNWLIIKGWLYILIFIMGYLFGGLMWK